MIAPGLPPRQGLYDPFFEHDACGFGFVVDLSARASHDIIRKALQVLCNLEHRGATGSEKNTGDGANHTTATAIAINTAPLITRVTARLQ